MSQEKDVLILAIESSCDETAGIIKRFQFLFCIQCPIFRRMRNVDHSRLHHMFVIRIIPVILIRFPHLAGADFSIITGQSQHLVSSGFYCSRLMDIDMSRTSRQYSLMGT